jgi:nucleotide-binding universal stress UspA family protein
MLYRTIVVPHDGSPFSERALERAAFIAKAAGARIVLVNATVLPAFVYSYHDATNTAINEVADSLVRSAADSTARALAEAARRLEEKEGVRRASYVHAVAGDPAELVLETAEKEGADLIVIGSRGLRGLSRLRALGSVARRVSEHARCPVLIVH